MAKRFIQQIGRMENVLNWLSAEFFIKRFLDQFTVANLLNENLIILNCQANSASLAEIS